MRWADVIVPTGNALLLDSLEKYRELRYPIFGPSKQSAQLEVNRNYGMQVLKKHGIDVPPYKMFKSLDEAETYCWKHDGRYVFKILGSDDNKALTYCGKDSADMINKIQRWKKQGMTLKGACMLQDFIPGVEFATSRWMGRNGFLKPIGEGFEHKKLMPSNYGQNTGEMGCYDEKTEVLTRSGWKFWPDVTKEDEIASLQNGATVFVKPSEVVNYDYVGPMVIWKNQTLDICVTPNHNMYVNRQHAARQGRDEYEFIEARDCTQSQYEILRTAEWEGKNEEFYKIPGYTHPQGAGFHTVEPIRIPMTPWARFLGIYIAEGSCANTVNIAQSHPVKSKKVKQIIEDTGLPYAEIGHGFNIYRKQVAQHLKPLGRSWEKRVPQYIKGASREVIEAFLDGYATGDGNTQPAGFRVFYTSNRLLADDVQELLLKIGRVGVIKNRGIREGRKFATDGHEIIQRRDAYEITERVKKTRSWLDARDKSTEMYSGKVYCATVPGHVMYVRREGKPFWCGNTVLYYTQKSKLCNEVLQPLEAFLVSIGHMGDIDVNCIIDENGKAWPLEFTCRLGWPAFFIMCSQHEEPVEWMVDACHGRDTLKVTGDVATGLVVALPPFPNKRGIKDEYTDMPILGIDEENWNDLHLAECKIGKGVEMVDGKPVQKDMIVSSGYYVGCVTGLGSTVRKANKAAYKNVEKIYLPDMLVRDDIGEACEKQIPVLKQHGFATSLEF